MAVLQNKIDFALVIAVNHANPNGDPLNGTARAKRMRDWVKFRMCA